MREIRETFRRREPAERSPAPPSEPELEVAAPAGAPARHEPRIEGKTWHHPAVRCRTVYRKSLSSSTPCFTNGAADHPTKIPESERSAAASTKTRAKTNSHS